MIFLPCLTTANAAQPANNRADYFYAIVRKDDQALLSEINYAIDQMNINEGDWSNVLFYKYYGNSSPSALSFTQRELAYIQDAASGKKQITVTFIGGHEPCPYVKDGKLKGILPDYFSALMELAGLSYKTVVPGDRAEYYDLAGNDGVDVVIDWRQDQLKADEVGRSGFYTGGCLNAGGAVVTRKDFSGEIHTLAADLLGDVAIEQGLIGDAAALNCQTRESALQSVLEGKADAAYVYTYTAQSFANSNPSAPLQYSMVDSMRFDFRMYVRSSRDHELITILNKYIGQMPDGTMSRLITTYTANTPESLSLTQYMLAIVNTLSRDCINVYAVNARTAAVRPVNIAGYAAAGLGQDSSKNALYSDVLTDYVNYRAVPEDRQYLLESFALDTVIEKLKTSVEYSGSFRVLVDGGVHTCQFTCASQVGIRDQDGFFLIGFTSLAVTQPTRSSSSSPSMWIR